MNNIKNVAIVGGTHGNEFTGSHLIRHWSKDPTEVTRESFKTSLFHGNPKAFEENRRFIDEDLNRCFSDESLSHVKTDSYESNRAAHLSAAIGPKGHSAYDFLIDLHTSTSNCGVMIILLRNDTFSLRLAAYLSMKIPQAHIHYIPLERGGDQSLSTLTPHSLAVEIGPIAQGLLRYQTYALTGQVVSSALDFIHAQNNRVALSLPEKIDVFQFQEFVTFPGNGPYAEAMVHESLQDRDYEPLQPGDPMFRKLDGSVINYEGSDTVYPVFINEAAYYNSRKAMSLTTKETLAVPAAAAAG